MRTVAVLLLAVVSGCLEQPPPSRPFQAAVFPAEFTWGTATSAWQMEGDAPAGDAATGPIGSNWSQWLAMGKARGGQTNPDGNGFLTRYAEDAQRAVDLGLTSFRVSVEWSRIAPAPGVIDEAELDHLDDVLQALVDRGLEPVLTLWHWTVPTWVQDPLTGLDRIASKERDVVDDFEAFVRVVVPRVKDKVDTYTVLNEPLTMVVAGYVDGTFPPGARLDIEGATEFGINLMYMHARAFDVIKELDDSDANSDGIDSFVGLTMTANDVYPEDPESDQERFAAESLNYVYNDWVISTLTTGGLDVDLDGNVDPTADTDPAEGVDQALRNRLEFIGVQYYGPAKVKRFELLDAFPPLYGLPLSDVLKYTESQDQLLPSNGMGREISARGFADTLDRYAVWGLPLIVTENGTTVNRRPAAEDPAAPPAFDEDQAAMYLTTHVWEVGAALARGVDVRGYFHWTLADNFEWAEGRMQRFGAYTVDFADPALPRTKNAMGQALQDIAAAGAVDEAIWGRYVLDRFPSDTTTAGQGPTTSADPTPR